MDPGRGIEPLRTDYFFRFIGCAAYRHTHLEQNGLLLGHAQDRLRDNAPGGVLLVIPDNQKFPGS